jgi:hypothetical protein
MQEIPDNWERAPDLAPTGDSLAFRSEQYPAFVVTVHPKRTHIYVKFKFMAESVHTIEERSFDAIRPATGFAEAMMAVASWALTGADGGNVDAIRDRVEAEE